MCDFLYIRARDGPYFSKIRIKIVFFQKYGILTPE
jgi:hypothetical protein